MDSFTSSSGSDFSKKEPIISNKSVALIDVSCQANLAYEVITYDSDDEMVKSRRGIPFGGLRNKKGHPIYSREDIREQYCITRKELEVLEHSLQDSSAGRLFGCLSTSHLPDSHCNKSSFLLLSCVHKRKNSSEVDEHSEPEKRFQVSNSQTISNVSEDDDSEGGFRHYSKSYPKLPVDPHRYNHFSRELRDNINRTQYRDPSAQRDSSRSKVKLHQSHSSGSQDINKSSIKSSIYSSKEKYSNSSTTSHSVDELVDNSSQQVWSSQKNTKIGDFSYDICGKKHVSFDSTDSKVRRSVTLGSGIDMNVSNIGNNLQTTRHSRNISPPSVSLTSMSSFRRDISPPVASQERLLGTKLPQIDSNVKHQSVSPSLSYTPSLSTPCRLVRRVIMKTQATQTEITGLVKSRSSRSIPAYLTLSPRACNQQIVHRRSFDLRVPTTPVSLCEYHQKLVLRQTNSWSDSDAKALALPLVKSRSVHGMTINANNIDYNEDEVMQVCIDGYNQFSSNHKLIPTHPTCDNNQPFLQPLKPNIKSYSNDEVFMPHRTESTEDNIFDGRLVRRHSAKADLAAEPIGVVPIASPPPGFGDFEVEDDFTSEELIERRDSIEGSPKKSNSESSHAMITDEGSDLMSSTTTDIDDLHSSTNNSKVTTSSPTVVSELNPDVPLTPPTGAAPDLPLIKSDSIELIELSKVDSPVIRLRKQMMDTLVSPDSESSSFQITSVTSSSDKNDDISDQILIEKEVKDLEMKNNSAEDLTTHSKNNLSFNTSTLRPIQRKSDPTIEDKDTLKDNESIKVRSLSVPTLKRPTSLPSKKHGFKSDEPFDERRSSSSSDASVPTQSPESIASTHYSINAEEIDSDVQDLTPIQEICSSDPSTTVEPTTIIETVPQIKPQIPPKPTFLLTERKKDLTQELKDLEFEPEVSESTERTDEEGFSEDTKTSTDEAIDDLKNTITQKLLDIKSKFEKESEGLVSYPEEGEEDANEEEDEVIIDEPSGGALIMRRSVSGELSTVSEVSEELSANGVCGYKSISSADKDYLELEDKESGGPVLTLSNDGVSSENIAIHSGATSPSLADSTTSGSFMIDVSVTESVPEIVDQTIGKAGSLPCLPTQIAAPISIVKVASEGGVGDIQSRSPRRRRLTTTVSTDLEPIESTINKKYEPIVGQLVDLITESSQATERDIEKSEFSLQHQSSQDIDEESLSLDALNHSFSLIEGIEEFKAVKDEDIQELALLHDFSTSESTTTQQISDIKVIDVSEENTSSKSKKSEKVVKTKVTKPMYSSSESHSQSHTLLSQEEFYIMQRRSRSLSRSPEKILDSESPKSLHYESCSHHHFTCSQCGESANPHTVPSLLRRSRLERTGIPYLYRKSMTIDDIYFDSDDEEEDAGVHTDSYRSSLWVYIGRKEEIAVWDHRNPLNGNGDRSLTRSESDESTLSEKGFRKHYEAITHRLIHRKASIEMYKRILNRTFVIEKVLTLIREEGEFGFRIHGSRPVVVSAIEKGTPAEVNGLEVGDIIVTVNDTNVLEASHSEVVKLAHTGSDTLKLEVICISKSIKKNQPKIEHNIIINGYLLRLTDKSVDKERSDSNQIQIHGTNKLWRRRWFVLKSDYCLYWYKNPKCTEPVGAISLHGYCAGVSNETIFGQSFVFRLVRYATPQKYFAAIDCETAGQWVKALNQSATRVNQIDPFIDSTLHNIHKNPLSLKHLDCYGYLGKFSKRRKVWRHRYFVLKDACLYFYTDANTHTALGVFYLHGYKVQSCAMIGKKHTFEVIPPEPKFRHIWLLSDSDADKKRWLAALEYSIDRWIKLK